MKTSWNADVDPELGGQSFLHNWLAGKSGARIDVHMGKDSVVSAILLTTQSHIQARWRILKAEP